MRDGIRATQALHRPAPDVRTRRLLTEIGHTLRTVNPGQTMREVTRLAYAGRTAASLYGIGTPQAAATTGRLLRHMPRLDSPPTGITRVEYGLRLIAQARD
ncbi:hypothetical protein ACFW6X_15790 [Streptomyces bacillaris]|uniref:hypothetical protein n=1 Tax=Streptomyces bacillaris TaxID=68179 RepID=UPI003694229F